jgi:hypothetical protein
MILFLDFDGVLHPEPCYRSADLFCNLPRLERVLRHFSSVEVVITSTWRESRSMSEMQAVFAPDIAKRVIGATPDFRTLDDPTDRLLGYPRQLEIEAWMRLHRSAWEKWAALDDRPYLFRPFLPNLVVCNSAAGFDEAVELELRQKLSR